MKHIDDIKLGDATKEQRELKHLVGLLRANRSDALYWRDEDRKFVNKTNILAARIRRESAKLGVLTPA